MNVLIINDICSHGQVATNAIKPCLETVGANVYSVPTCLISSTFNKSPIAVSDTTDYLTKCLDIYDKNIKFDYIIVGFVYNKDQAYKIIDFINSQKEALTIVDPTMADNGKMYKSLNQTNLNYVKEICRVSNIIVPNITEARFLCDDFKSDIKTIKEKLKNEYKSIIITSIDNNEVFIYDKKRNIEKFVEYENIDGYYPGTGDIFVGLMVSKFISERDIYSASKYAANKISEILKSAKTDINTYNGIPISKYL